MDQSKDIPLLSFDGEDRSVFDPQEALQYYQKVLGLEKIQSGHLCLGCFEAQILEELVKRTGSKENSNWIFHNQPERRLYSFQRGGKEVSLLCFGFGAAPAATMMEFLIACGIEQFLFFGSAGALQPNLQIGDLVIGDRAIREEGVSYHYLKPGYDLVGSPRLSAALKKICQELDLIYHAGSIWTTDAVFRETRNKVQRYKDQGVLVVEMEAAALYAVASYRGVEAASLFYISDSLADLTWRPGFLEKAVGKAIGQGCQALLGALDRISEGH
jgi:uridine phosphorylase